MKERTMTNIADWFCENTEAKGKVLLRSMKAAVADAYRNEAIVLDEITAKTKITEFYHKAKERAERAERLDEELFGEFGDPEGDFWTAFTGWFAFTELLDNLAIPECLKVQDADLANAIKDNEKLETLIGDAYRAYHGFDYIFNMFGGRECFKRLVDGVDALRDAFDDVDKAAMDSFLRRETGQQLNLNIQ